MRTRIWSSICIVAVLAVTGSAAFAQDHRGGWQGQGQFQDQRQQNLQSQQQGWQNITDQYIQNNRFREGDRNGQYFQNQSRFNDPSNQFGRGWSEGNRYYREPVFQGRQAQGLGFRFQLGRGFDRDMRNENRPGPNYRGPRPSDSPRAYRQQY